MYSNELGDFSERITMVSEKLNFVLYISVMKSFISQTSLR